MTSSIGQLSICTTPHDVASHGVSSAPEMAVHAVAHAPAEVLVEGRGVVEHVAHVYDAVDHPPADVLG